MFFESIRKLPYLNLGNRCGHTDYIDFIRWDEVTEPSMYGVDCFKREFVVIKFVINKNSKDNKKCMQTFFRRYSDSNLWMGCGPINSELLWTGGGMRSEDFIFLDDILNGKTVEINENLRSQFTGSTVELYNEKEWKAAEIIQKNWKICRYDPTYKMCEKVQTNNLNSILEEY